VLALREATCTNHSSESSWLDYYAHSAVHPSVGFSVCYIPKGYGNTMAWFCEALGKILAAGERAGAFIISVAGDNDAKHNLIDGALSGVAAAIEVCKEKNIPFFSELTYKPLDLECFPYRSNLNGQLQPPTN